MDTGVISGVHWPSFIARSRGTVNAVTENLGKIPDERVAEAAAALVDDDGLDLVDWRCAARRYLEVANLVRLKGVFLRCSQPPRICSVISNPRRAKWLPKLSIKVIP